VKRLFYLAGIVACATLIAIAASSVTLAQAPAPGAAAAVTFHKDIEPILQKNCQSCHRPGQIAPMSLLSYPAVRPWARAIKTKVVAREMPPWFADPHAGPLYTTDRSLQQPDIDLIAKWVDSGAPEGDAKDAPPPVEWPKDGWVIQPDYVVRGPSFKVPARPPSNVIEWTVIIVPTGFTKDTWITSVEIKPSDLQVTHHICIGFSLHHDGVQYYTPVWADKPRDEEGVEIRPENGQSSGRARDFRGDPADEGGETSGGCYLPGNQAFDYRPFNAGRLIPAGANIVIAQHYTPSGKDSVDFPQIGFTIAKETPKYRWVSGSVSSGGRLAIPPNEPNYQAPSGVVEFATDARLVMMMPHMHVRGRDMTYTVVHPDGRKEVALSVPKYDFNWQMQYVLSNPVKVAPGTKLHVEAHYNNSTSNKYNPNPNRWVYPGNMTWEEMMSPFFGVIVDTETDPTTVFRRGAVNNGGGE
jgi:mono/diheme cytochrome c family protein